MLNQLKNIILVTGHYGCGKTNLSLNIALWLQQQGRAVALADMDITNPYFRTTDYREFVQQQGIEVITSEYFGSTVELPALGGQLESYIGGEKTLLIDVGGDDTGAVALGRYAQRIKEQPYTMLYVVNRFRLLMEQPQEAVAMMEQIEAVSRLRATHIVNNSNLAVETTPQDVLGSVDYAQAVARQAALPLAFTAVRRDLAPQLTQLEPVLPVDIIVKTPWN